MKKLKGIVLVVILLLASIMMPFDVYADGLIVVNGSDYLLGINVDLYDSSLETYVNQAFISSNNGTSNYSQYTQTNVINNIEVGTYKYTFVFNKSYVGRVVMQYVVPGSQTTRQFTLFVNGTTAEYYSSRDNRYTATSTFINNWTLSSAQLVEHDDIESLEQIIDLLTDIYTDTTDLVGAASDQLTELQNIVSKINLSNTYLDSISKIRRFDIPLESLVYNLYLIRNHESYLYYDSNIYFQYPVYRFTNTKNVLQQYTDANVEYDWIFITDCSQPALLKNYMNISNADADVTFKETYNLGNVPNIGYVYYYHAILKSTRNASTIISIDFSQTSPNIFVGILLNKVGYKNYSLEFALQNGLTNDLLDNIKLIANGSTQSNQAASDLESSNDQMEDDMNNLATIENEYNQQLNNQLQQIDFTSPLQNNAGILPAANFVITIFNGLINNNPFSVLIIIVCILLIGKKVIGK